MNFGSQKTYIDSFFKLQVNDPEPASALLHHILHERLGVNPEEHPIMITEPAWNTPKARQVMTEMAFEGEKMPALYFGSSGVLSAYVSFPHS